MKLVMRGHIKGNTIPPRVVEYKATVPDIEIESARFDRKQHEEDEALKLLRHVTRREGIVLWKVEWVWQEEEKDVQ